MLTSMKNKIEQLGTEQRKRVTLVTGATNYNMSLNDTVLEVTTINSGTITLPPVGHAVGKTFTLHGVSQANGQTCTVRPFVQGSTADSVMISSTSIVANRTFTQGSNGYLVLTSTGTAWIVLGHAVAAA